MCLKTNGILKLKIAIIVLPLNDMASNCQYKSRLFVKFNTPFTSMHYDMEGPIVKTL